MICDCLQIFETLLAGDNRLILDHYVPKDGTYILVDMAETGVFCNQMPLELHYNKKTGILEGQTASNYRYIQQLDYYSKLVEMNKPIDPKKTIHSNSYLTFFVKKESLLTKKVTPPVIAGYYEVLKAPLAKYEKRSKSKEVYQLAEQELGEPDRALIEQIKLWLLTYLSQLELDLTRKDYLKLFFVWPDESLTLTRYRQEGRRYLLPNIYNSNDTNVLLNGELWGLPNDNLGMNAKKPFLEHKTRKQKVPCLVTQQQALLQSQFFDYLLSQASTGKTNLYIDPAKQTMKFYKNGEFAKDFHSGYFMRLQKGKEVEIHSFDVISDYQYHLPKALQFKEIIEVSVKVLEKFEPGYGRKSTMGQMQTLIDEVFFSKWLLNNYFTDTGSLSMKDGALKVCLIRARERLFAWFYKGDSTGLDRLLDRVSLALVKHSVAQGNESKAKHQLNLRWSLADYFSNTTDKEDTMRQVRTQLRSHINTKEDWEFAGDQEYYYAVGQLVYYYIKKSKAKEIPESFVNPFLNAKSDAIIKKRLQFLYKKFNYDIKVTDVRANRLISHVMMYRPTGKVDQDLLIGGFTDGALIYEKKKEEQADE